MKNTKNILLVMLSLIAFNFNSAKSDSAKKIETQVAKDKVRVAQDAVKEAKGALKEANDALKEVQKSSSNKK